MMAHFLSANDLATLGAMEGIPKAVSSGYDYARVAAEPKCQRRGYPYCEYHIEWKPQGLGRWLLALRHGLSSVFKGRPA